MNKNVTPTELMGLRSYGWYYEVSAQYAEYLLKQHGQEGCFIVRKSSIQGLYTLSLHTKELRVTHFRIRKNSFGEFYLSEQHFFKSIPDLIDFHQLNSSVLPCRLETFPCGQPVPRIAGAARVKWEILHSELNIQEVVGSGGFSVVRRAIWRGSNVAVKMLRAGRRRGSEYDFLEEAIMMIKLQHPNLLQLYGVSTARRPMYIISEYMQHGCLLSYLQRYEQSLAGNVDLLLNFCIQVCEGMSYLEQQTIIHRDLAARNCLVGLQGTVKVGDFGLAGYAADLKYSRAWVAIRWAPPEVLNHYQYSSKSDVWSFGVLMWEVFTFGKTPYGPLSSSEIVDRVERGFILEKPSAATNEIYEMMKKCWSHSPDDRFSFRTLTYYLQYVRCLIQVPNSTRMKQ